ncbi:PCP degradation transcriptional activation protein [Ensifer sp. M14]|uniref:glycosyl transferase family protein n=1 Tax=Ensifer sp. M14 TaxID=2203782 RepID=UPI000E1CA2DF|nr:glycosyl transferase family protein [Ensifer sp. M14]RDL49569.1 PCP degradation transcriptional activation protein [Ensifer sp. M14]
MKVQAQASPASHERQTDMSKLRLLLALDALLRENSVSRAAASVGLQPSAMSRLLSQLREEYDDPLFLRTGHGLRPTPLAETLRLRVRALAAETEALFERAGAAAAADPQEQSGWEGAGLIAAPPLSVRPSLMLDGEPTPQAFAAKLARIGDDAAPQRRLARSIATIGTGAGRSRPLSEAEAEDALTIILAGEADPVQIGALMVALQYRGATAVEIAGFVKAIRRHVGAVAGSGAADLDWPCYLSPKLKTAPWFLHAARLVASAGYRVMLHGHYGQDGTERGKLEIAAARSGIAICASLEEADSALTRSGIAYLPLPALSPQIYRLLGLYGLMEMRIPLGAAVHLINPLGARTSLLGVANSAARTLSRDIALLLGLKDLTILGNTRDHAEFTPYRQTPVYRLIGSETVDLIIPALPAPPVEGRVGLSTREYWEAVWTGAARDERAETTIITTTAAALLSLGNTSDFETACETARALWTGRSRQMAR